MYSATAPNGLHVAIKVLEIAGLPPRRSAHLVRTYLNEVALLERLRQESRHVVFIHDFDFDPRSGRGKLKVFRYIKNLFDVFCLRLYCYGIRW